MPMTAFMGVRISWLMFAMNSDLMRSAASATSLAFDSSSFAETSCDGPLRDSLLQIVPDAA